MIDGLRVLVTALRQLAGTQLALRRIEARGDGIRLDRTVDVRSPDRLLLDSEIFVDRGVVLHCGGMDWCPDVAGIAIGARTYIGPHSVLFGAGGIEIGEAVLISPGVVITSHQHGFERTDVEMRAQPLDFGRVVVERDVWIGANATVLPGVRVGEASIVGAGAVVTRDVPARTLVVGVPAQVVRGR